MKRFLLLSAACLATCGTVHAQAPGSVGFTVKNDGPGSTIYWTGPGSPPVLWGLAEGGLPAAYALDSETLEIEDGALKVIGGTGGTWGTITGTLSAQTDLQAALNAKLNSAAVSAFGLTLIDDADAETARGTLGLGTLATQSATITDYLTTASAASTYVALAGSYSDPAWITALAWSKITGAPSFLTGNQTITLSGDVTGSGATAITTTLANDAVTFAKIQNISTAHLIGRHSSGSGDPELIGLDSGGLTMSGGNLVLTNTGVTAASYTAANVTVDAQGRITAASAGIALPANPSPGYSLLYNDGDGPSYISMSNADPFTPVMWSQVNEGSNTGLRFPRVGSEGGWVDVWAPNGDGDYNVQLPTAAGTLLTTTGNGGSLTNLDPYALQQRSASDGQVLMWSTSNSRWQPGTVSGSGTVTSVAVSGSDGIQVDSGSPITNTGTIALGVNASSLKTHLSLNNVENTALSTWAGSSNLTTLGTITTGTWNGSIIAPGYLGTGSSITTKFLRGDGTWQTISSGGTIGGTVGTTDNAIPRADGTGGSTLQGSLVTIDDSGNVSIGAPLGLLLEADGRFTHRGAAGEIYFVQNDASNSYGMVWPNRTTTPAMPWSAGNLMQISGITGSELQLSFAPLNLATAASITGTLPVGNGGTGQTSLGAVNAADFGSGAATDGQVLTADGAGGAAWETPAGGGGGTTIYGPAVITSDVVSTSDATWTDIATVSLAANTRYKLRLAAQHTGNLAATGAAFGVDVDVTPANYLAEVTSWTSATGSSSGTATTSGLVLSNASGPAGTARSVKYEVNITTGGSATALKFQMRIHAGDSGTVTVEEPIYIDYHTVTAP